MKTLKRTHEEWMLLMEGWSDEPGNEDFWQKLDRSVSRGEVRNRLDCKPSNSPIGVKLSEDEMRTVTRWEEENKMWAD